MLEQIYNKKIAIYTLGCKVNQYESDSMMDILEKEGCKLVPFEECADVYIINTCAVTNMAERKSRQIANRAKKTNPSALVVLTGCYVQAEKEAIEKSGEVGLVIGNNCKKNVAHIINSYFENQVVEDNFIDIHTTKEYENMWLSSPHDHTRAYVKVQDGCNNFCSYCIIPYTRGRIRSRDSKEIMDEITALSENGILEVVLTGINLSSYHDIDSGGDLLDLIDAVSTIPKLLRVRLGSLEPRIITERFLKGVKDNKKFCPHFHLSLQSACNETLRRMNRHYTIEEYTKKCKMIRQYFERPAITTDVIVGFPGETDEEFEITRQNLEALQLYEMHIFKYSRRKNTVAYSMQNHVSDLVKNSRSDCLLKMTAKHKRAFEQLFVGETLDVLVEEVITNNNRQYLRGHTDRYLLVDREMISHEEEALVNTVIPMVFS